MVKSVGVGFNKEITNKWWASRLSTKSPSVKLWERFNLQTDSV